MDNGKLSLLHQLAGLYGIITTYRDYNGQWKQASPRALLAVLAALGAPVDREGDLPEALHRRRVELWQRRCEPVQVYRAGRAGSLELRLEASRWQGEISCRLDPEAGETRQWSCAASSLPLVDRAKLDGVEYISRRLPLPAGLPPGYHRLTLQWPGGGAETMLIAAPARAYQLPAGGNRLWGVFAPLYALRSHRSWATGDLADLEGLHDFVRLLGGDLVGTLPLLAAYLDEPFDPSPYAPVSRLFWNELYLDVSRIPELQQCGPARELLDSPAFGAEVETLRRAPLVDYRQGMAVKRRVLELLARCCYAAAPARLDELRRWAAENPAARDYARFRAAVSRLGPAWDRWPERMRGGDLQPGDVDPEVERYHLYVQWEAHRQFRDLAARTRRHGPGLYLDFPLGVHGQGFDVWRERGAFATGVSCGAPPDRLNTGGQNWGFPPLHPDGLRQQAYRYYIAAVRHHLRHAGALRLDHVMGLHRLFWIPAGLPTGEGVYVRYPAEEFYAIWALESRRHQTVLVGEDLGTVPGGVREAMGQHGISRMYVLPFEFEPHPRRGLHPVPAGALACLNTHDMPPFTAFWRHSGPRLRWVLTRFLHRRGLLKTPVAHVQAVLAACYKYLAAGRAGIVLVNLEDLWLETAPQNIPGTGAEKPNWRRKARRNLDDLHRLPGVLNILKQIDRFRKRRLGKHSP